jgi:predicted RNase H-like nuclease (RuvC/YqgF family)
VIANQHTSNQSATQVTTVHGLKYEKLTREELSRSLDEKDQAIRHHEQTISNQEVHLQHLKHKNEELQDRVNDLGAQLEVER